MTRTCPTPRKAAYRERVSALIALANIEAKDRPAASEKRAYRCPCGAWHLTSKGKAKQR